MNILSTLKHVFSGSKVNAGDWNMLTVKSQLNAVMSASSNRPQLVYKHSHTCSVCFMARKELESSFDEIRGRADMHFVNVIKARQVSNALAEELHVRHESPQVLIINHEECVWHKSHYAIKAGEMLDVLN